MKLERASCGALMLLLAAGLAGGCGGGDAAAPAGEGAVVAGGAADGAVESDAAPLAEDPAAAAAVAGDCPPQTRIETLEAGEDWSGSGPHDLADVETAVARRRSDKEVQVVLASVPIEGEMRTFEWLDPPVTGKDWVLRLKFLDTEAQVDPGTYGPAVMPYKPRRMSFDLGFIAADGKGRRADPGFREGTAEITSLTADRVCGRIEMTSPRGGAFKAEFDAPFSR